ncbi:MAG: hypothetical protein IJ573_07165 [Clostridia bacterium]|nr:hypothetical protein [Clostridia bacterium]
MDLEKESGMLTLIFADDTVQYRDRILPTGSIACMALNIPGKALEELLPLCQRIAAVNTMLHTGTADKIAMKSACLAAHDLLKLIARYEPFTFFSNPKLDQRLDQVFSVEAFKKIQAYNRAVQIGQVDEEAGKRFGPTRDLLGLAPALSNYYEAITMLQKHIGPFADKLDGKDVPRTKEAYLTQFSQSFPENFRIGDGTDSWMSMANVSLQYTAGVNGKNGQKHMKKQMHFLTFGGMLRADFFEGLSVGHAPKRCAICGRWFLTTDARHTKYCSDLCPTDPLGRKCRVIGNMQGRAARELAADHPLNAPYNRRMNTINQCLSRGTISRELADAMKKLAKDKKQRAKADLAYAKGAYQREMEQDALKAEAQKLLG